MKKIFVIAVIAFVALPMSGQSQRMEEGITPERALLNSMFENIRADKLFDYVKHLSDSTIYEGRLAGSKGMERASEWASDLFRQWGLSAFEDAPNYIQSYPHPCTEVHGGSLTILFPIADLRRSKNITSEISYITKSYQWAKYWYAGSTSGSGNITADVVYAGYGVCAPELGYDDYAGIDVKGKIVLIEGETPNTSRNRDTLLMWYKHTLHHTKIENAVKHGAIGMLYYWVPGPNNCYNKDFVYAFVTEDLVNELFVGTGRTYRETIANIRKNKKPSSFDMGKKANINMVTTHDEKATGKNVVGYVKGSDPVLCNEYVIVSAHLDHLGMIPYHIAGANDNNSSTAVLMGVAEALAKSQVKPKRSVIFINLDGEEAGLTGSTWFINNPLVSKEKIKLIINLEACGIGRMMSSTASYLNPGLNDYLVKAAEEYVHLNVRTGTTEHITRPRTDGAVFMKAGYPCIDVRAAGGNARYYHQPEDDWPTMDGEMLENACKMVYWTAINAANE